MTTYYIDFVGGSDANAGTSTGAAFKHCPGDDNATGLALTKNGTYVAGDTFQFKGGVTYVGEIDIDKTGTLGNPITYDGNTAGTWGTGRAIIDLEYTYYHGFDSTRATRNYITIKGFNIFHAKNINNTQNQTITRGGSDITGVNYGGNGTGDTGHGFIHNFSGSNWTIQDCQLAYAENWDDRAVFEAETDADPQSSASVPADQAGINLATGTSNCTITNVEIWAIGRDCVRVLGSGTSPSTGHVFTNNNFGGGTAAGADVGWFSVGIRMAGATNITVRGNKFHDGWQYQGNEEVAGVPKQRSHAGDWLHIHGSNTAFGASSITRDILIEGNYFYNSTAFISSMGTAIVFVEDGVNNITFRNNLFINDFSGTLELEVCSDVKIYNNTFVSLAPTISGVHTPIYFFTGGGGGAGMYPTDVKIKNNVFIALNTNSVGTAWATTSSGLGAYPESDYNRFYVPNIGSTRIIYWNNTPHTLAQWQAASGQDTNSTVGDPLLLGTLTDLPTSGGAGNYNAASGSSPIVGTGVTLSGFTDDYLEQLRSAPWDIGAFEYGAAIVFSGSSRIHLRS